jgi:hypothetical protein
LNAVFRRRVSATRLFDKPPLAILDGTSNPIGFHNEHSLFQRISIHLHYDVKAYQLPSFLNGATFEFLATDPKVWVGFLALPDFLRSSGSGMGSTEPSEYK